MPSWLTQHNNTTDDVSTAHSIKSWVLRKLGERRMTQKLDKKPGSAAMAKNFHVSRKALRSVIQKDAFCNIRK